MPKSDWFNKLELKTETIKNGTHDIYKNEAIIISLCNAIKMNNKSKKSIINTL